MGYHRHAQLCLLHAAAAWHHAHRRCARLNLFHAVAVMVGGAADFSGAFDPLFSGRLSPPWYNTDCKKLTVVMGGAADFSNAFDPLSSATFF
jgi:hypothetical protein